LHLTVLGVIAFFILFAASKAEGFVSLLGKLLGYWVLLLALAGLGIGVFHAVTGKPMGPGWMMHHRGWHHGPPGTFEEQVPPPGTPAPDKAPAAPEPAKPATPAKPG
jgi:hypothetical protein